ncbi:MAG TPA: ABC transporter permease [Vicinamibacterales bacterium]|nr:ABC transporter permease [Vicinamibacterales bacterium]
MPNLRLALRTLFKSPFITLVAILSLALGIGANSAIFSLFDQMILRPLPVPQPEQLVNLKTPGPKPGSNSCSQAGGCDEIFSYPMFRDLERVQTSFTGLAAHRNFGGSVGYKGTSLGADGLLVSGSYFPVLGITPALGRLLTPDDDKTIGSHFVVVLSHDYWRTRFEMNPAILNETLIINGQAMTVVGVAPRGFNGTTLGNSPDLFVPISMRGLMSPGFNGFENRRTYWAYVFGRLKPGVTIEQATTAINGPYHAILNDVEAPLQTGMSNETMARFRSKQITTEPGNRGQSSMDNEARTPLMILLAVTGTVLLIACANIANLLLVRGAGRAAEMAVRLSIGANRRQLITQLLTESIMLAAFGAVAGLFIARWTLDLIQSFMPPDESGLIAFSLSPTMVIFAGGAALITGIAFGLFPALHTTRPDLAATLKNQAGQPGGAKAARRFRTTLATVQIAMSMALLVPAGLFAKSLFNVSRVDLGLKTDHMVLFSLSPELNSYTTERTRQLFERIEDEIAALPGVTSMSAAMVPVLAGDNWGNSLVVEGFEAGPDTNTNASFNGVGPGYFKTMSIPLMAGREFTRADVFGSPKVAVVNQAFAKKFNLGTNPIGKRFGLGGPNAKPDIEIVGFVQDAKYSDVKREVPPQYFLPYRQEERLGFAYFYVRTATPPEQMLQTIPAVIRKLDAGLPIADLKTMDQQIRENVSEDRIISTLSLAFAVLATVLAAIGLYGVLAYTVAQRTREFGLRMALGADGGTVRGMVMKQVGKMALVGGVIGMVIAIGVGRLAQSLLFQMDGSDPLVLAASAFALALVAIGAGFLPALRASKIDPMNALRYE